MADLTVGTIVPQSQSRTFYRTADASLAAGEVCYIDSDGEAAEADAVTNYGARGICVAIDGSGVAACVYKGSVDLGATLTIGTQYVLSDTAGKIMPSADLSSGDRIVLLGIAYTTALLMLDIVDTGMTVA